MDQQLQQTINLIMHDYGDGKEYPVTLWQGEGSGENKVLLRGYGLYSVIVGQDALRGRQFRMYLEPLDESSGERKLLIDSTEDEKRMGKQEQSEYFSQYQSGFWFYKSRESDAFRIVLETGGMQYVSGIVNPNFYKTQEKRSIDEQELLDMVQTVYEEQPLLLLSVFRKSPLSVFTGKDGRLPDAVDTQLALIERCLRVYNRQYSGIRKVLKFKLQSYRYVDRIDKLTGLTPETLAFMAQNPQYLVEIQKKRGIRYKGKVYLPEKTLVTRNVADYGTYENCYILSFLKMLMYTCEKLKIHLKLAAEDALQRERRAQIKSQKMDFAALAERYQSQMNQAVRHAKNAKRLYMMYRTAFGLKDNAHVTESVSKPRMTAVFRQIPEYNAFYTDAFEPWFSYGIQIGDVPAADVYDTFSIAVSTPSTTYELYIVCRWIQYLIAHGYTFDARRAHFAGVHEKASRYSDHAYEFVFEKQTGGEPELLTLYYSPSVYIPVSVGSDRSVQFNENNVDEYLYRNTRNSIVSREDHETNGKGAHYEPDFILKYQKKTVVRYIMADAKHKEYEEVRKDEMPRLLYKYIDSIRALRTPEMDVRIAGLCAVYHKHSFDEDGNLLDAVDYFEFNQNFEEEPFTKLLYMSVDADTGWERVFADMLTQMKQFHIDISTKGGVGT